MTLQLHTASVPDEQARDVYRLALTTLKDAEIPFIVGGAYAFTCYTGISRQTKDLDVFIRQADLTATLDALAAAGFEPENTYPHWLAKARRDGHFVDVIHNLANSIGPVDEEWFRHALPRDILGVPVLISAPEEMIWSKSFTMERDRYDGADIAHLIRVSGPELDWQRLLKLFGHRCWRVLFSHLILFNFIYPGERRQVPSWVLKECVDRMQAEQSKDVPDDKLCQGPLLAHLQYVVDVESWGYQDGRLKPWGNMTPEQRAVWQAGLLNGV